MPNHDEIKPLLQDPSFLSDEQEVVTSVEEKEGEGKIVDLRSLLPKLESMQKKYRVDIESSSTYKEYKEYIKKCLKESKAEQKEKDGPPLDSLELFIISTAPSSPEDVNEEQKTAQFMYPLPLRSEDRSLSTHPKKESGSISVLEEKKEGGFTEQKIYSDMRTKELTKEEEDRIETQKNMMAYNFFCCYINQLRNRIIEEELAVQEQIEAKESRKKSFIKSFLFAANDPTRYLSVSNINYAALGVVLGESAYDLATDCGAATQSFMHSAFFSYGMPVLLATLAFEGFSSALMAQIDKKTEDKNVATLEGLSKGINSTVLLVLRLGIIPTTAATLSYLMPGLFFIIVAGMIVKEERLLRITQKKIRDLEANIREDQKALAVIKALRHPSGSAVSSIKDIKKSLITFSEDPHKNKQEPQNVPDGKASVSVPIDSSDKKLADEIFLAKKIEASRKDLKVLKIKEQHLHYSKWALRAALISVALMTIAAACPPLGLATVLLTTTALAIFFMVVTAIRLIKKNEQKAIQKIESNSRMACKAKQDDKIRLFSEQAPRNNSNSFRGSDMGVAAKSPVSSFTSFSFCSRVMR